MSHPFEFLQKREDLSGCCRNLLNLDVKRTRHDTLKATCRKCGRGHIRLHASGAVMGMMSRMEPHPSGLLVPRA